MGQTGLLVSVILKGLIVFQRFDAGLHWERAVFNYWSRDCQEFIEMRVLEGNRESNKILAEALMIESILN